VVGVRINGMSLDAPPAPALTITTVNVSAPDPGALARFYQRLLGYEIAAEEPDWVLLRDPGGGGVALACQSEADYARPVWPAGPGDQQMMMHLEIQVTDLEGAVAHATACGATLAESQPQDDVRVCLDPAGHPFCLWVES
jgi:catechol 2,3-dioxygenase-like lactoylglutathione lyase family enzyme